MAHLAQTGPDTWEVSSYLTAVLTHFLYKNYGLTLAQVAPGYHVNVKGLVAFRSRDGKVSTLLNGNVNGLEAHLAAYNLP